MRVKLAFKTEGELKRYGADETRSYCGVEAQKGGGGKDATVVRLHDDRSKDGRVVVEYVADRTLLDNLKLRVYVPGMLGGAIYVLRVKDLAEPIDETREDLRELRAEIQALRRAIEQLEERLSKIEKGGAK